ncbi:putative ribonuclease H-like domain-containing protein [Tanacetum coccineum]
MKKMYCLVVTDDYSRFTWVFFLATKDETSGILKSFITGIENLVDHKVKVIRCDNGTEFKNKEMNQFCEMKGILRQFSVARTPQQNGVDERRNRTLIEEEERTLSILHFCTIMELSDPPFSKIPKSSHDDGSNLLSGLMERKVDKDPEKKVNQADMNNLDTTIQVSPILDQVIRDLQSTTQRRKMSNNLKEHGKKPKKIIHAFKGSKWIEAMQEELSTIFISVQSDKNDEKEIVIRNIARLVAQVYTQEEGIYYDEVFARFEDPDFPDRVYKGEKALYRLHQAPRAWYETLSIYLLDNGFQRGKIDKTLFIKGTKGDILLVQVYVDDMISFGSTKKELCNAFEKLMHEKFQMSYMGELTFFLGLQVQQKKDGIFISQDKYVVEILKKFGFTDVKTTSTPMETQKPLLKDEDGKKVDVHTYQVNPKVSHLCAVKRIFRYLKGQPKLGICILKDSLFDLVAYTDSDLLGASFGRKSTIGVDGNKIIINESTVRRDLQLEDAEGIDCLSNSTIFEQLALMGAKTTVWNEFSSTMASAIICLATNQKFNFSKYIFESMVKNLDNVSGNFLMYPRFVQVFVNQQLEGRPSHKRIYDAPSHTKKIFGNMKRVGVGLQFGEVAAALCASSLEEEQDSVGISRRVESSGDKDSLGKDTSKQGRRINVIDADDEITLVSVQDDADAETFDVNTLIGDERFEKCKTQEWDDIQARVNANMNSSKMQSMEEQEELSVKNNG